MLDVLRRAIDCGRCSKQAALTVKYEEQMHFIDAFSEEELWQYLAVLEYSPISLDPYCMYVACPHESAHKRVRPFLGYSSEFCCPIPTTAYDANILRQSCPDSPCFPDK